MGYRDEFKEVQSNAFWTAPRVFLGLVLFLVMAYGLGFLATGGELAIYKFWAPKQENVRRQVFENTQSYVQGKIEYLTRLEYQYKTAETPDSKGALKSLIISEASNIDNDKLPPELQSFIRGLKGGL